MSARILPSCETFPRRAGKNPPGFRLLPYRTLDGGGLLLAFRPEQVYVNGERRPEYWAALSPGPLRAGEDCEALIGGEYPE